MFQEHLIIDPNQQKYLWLTTLEMHWHGKSLCYLVHLQWPILFHYFVARILLLFNIISLKFAAFCILLQEQ